ncbi:MAG TPA: GlsB/YeaQ/YmgE family stress response membrane protein [Patescibacteria group bacterium]|jgi:uncharacterized membrane protein YeaQ/YmgE (transglycosylase-associated protein family)
MPTLVVSWIVVGALAGFLTYSLSRRRLPGGLFANLVVGIVGALVGGYLISDTTGTDVARGAVTWGILAAALVAALTASFIVQGEAKARTNGQKS